MPQKKRQALVSQFQSDPATRVFLATNAGSTGLNLQAAEELERREGDDEIPETDGWMTRT